MKKRLTKPLSILLAIVMLFTSINIMMPVVADAAATPAQINALKDALAAAKAAGVTSPGANSYSLLSSGDAGTTIMDYTAEGYIYNVAKALFPVFQGEAVVNTDDGSRPTWWRTLMQSHIHSLTGNDPSYNVLITNLLAPSTHDWGRNNRRHHTKTTSAPGYSNPVTMEIRRTTEAAVMDTFPVFSSLPSGATSAPGTFKYWANTGRQRSERNWKDYYYWVRFTSTPASQEIPLVATNLVVALDDFGSYFTPQLLATDVSALSWEATEALVVANAEAMQKTNAIRSALTNTNNYNKVISKYFNMTAINNFVAACEQKMYSYRAEVYADLYYDMDTGVFDLTVDWDDVAGVMSLRESINEIETLIAGIPDASVQAFVGPLYPFFSITQVRAFQQNFDYNYERSLLQYVKMNADNYLSAHYNGIDSSSDAYFTNIPNAQFDIMYGNFKAYKDILSRSYAAENFNAVFGNANGAKYILDFLNLLVQDATLRDYNIFHAEYYRYFTGLYAEDISKLKAERVIEKHIETALEKRDEYFAEYNSAIALYGKAQADEIFPGIAQLDATLNAHINNVKIALGARLKAQVAAAKALVPADLRLDWHNFNVIKASVNNLEHIVYDEYNTTNYIDLQTKTDYLWLKNNVLDLVAAFVNNGFNSFVKTNYDAQYPTRKPNADDFIRSETPADDFVVTESKLAGIVEKLEKIILSDDLAAALDMEESFGERLSDIVAKNIYKDSLVNELIGILYPTLLEEFSELLEDLPTEFKASFITIKVTYRKGLREISQDLGLDLYPDRLASKVDMMKFPTAWAELTEAGQKWENLFDEDEDVLISWGIDEEEDMAKREALFKDAMAVAFAGLQPLFLTLLCNTNISLRSKDVATAVGGSIDANVYLKSGGNEGYAKTFVPIFEMLGIPAAQIKSRAQANAVTNARGIVDLIFDPLIYFMDQQLATKPLQTIIDVLPNLAYSLSMDLIAPTLSGLAATLDYQIEMDYKLGTYSIRDTIVVDAGEMLDLEDMGLDLSGFDGLINMLVEDDDEDAEPIELPFLNAGTIATLGELQRNLPSKRPSGVRNTIKADRADVMFFLFNYLLDAIGNEAFIDTLLGMLSGDDEDDDEDEGLSPEILEILGGLGDEASRGDIIAAVVELFNPREYEMLEHTWAEPVDGYQLAYLAYANNWGKAQSDYLSANIDNIVNAVGEMMELDEDIPTMLAGMLDDVFTADTLKSLTDTLADLDLDEELMGIIEGVLGIDLSAWSIYDEDYEPVVEDRDDFFDQLYTILAPLAPLFEFLFSGEDLSAFDGALTLTGYNGYGNGLIPLLEALGCEGLLSPAEYSAAVAIDQKNAIKAILDPIIGLIDKVVENPLSTILTILPKALYFLESGGLAVSVQNMLQSLLAVLDTVRPIYNINIQTILEMVAGNDDEEDDEDDSGFIGYLDIDRLDEITLDWVIGILEESTGLELDRILGNAIENMAKLSTAYTSANGKTAYTLNLEPGDIITILISVLIELINSEENQEVLAEMFELDEGILPAVVKVLRDSPIDIQPIKWFYFDENIDYDDIFADPESLTLPERSLVYLTYPNNWNLETVTYIDENLTGIINLILSLLDEDSGTIADMLDGVLDIYNDETVNSVISAIQSLISGLDETLLDLIGVVIDIDLSSWDAYDEDTVWGVTDRESFVSAMATALAPLERIFNWILSGEDIRMFHTSEGGDLITINGSQGYAYGLVPILEALGVTGLMNAEDFNNEDVDFEVKLENLLGSVLQRVDGILANPIDEIFALIPNLIYFLNADGMTASLNNLLGAIYNILDDVQPAFEFDLDEELGFPLSDLSLMNILAFAEEELELSLEPLKVFFEKFYFGEITHFISANNNVAFQMGYSADEGRKDIITIVFSLLLQVLDYDGNTDAFKEMLGEDVYAALKNVLHLGEFSIDMIDIQWIHTDKAGTDELINALETSNLFEYGYGTMWTAEKAKYVDDNINRVVDNLIYLLGVEINDIRVESMDDLLLSFLGTSLYTQDNVDSILEVVQDLIAEIDEVDPDGHVKAILKNSLGIDLNVWNEMDENTFNVPDNDKDAFIDAITEILAPLNPILGWLLAGDDLAFFVDENGQDYIYLAGANGYEYGLLPILEVLECEGIVSPAEFDADRDNMLRNILEPLLAKVDTILVDPVNEILNIMPALTYFINSNGLDASLKNLINPIRVILAAIEPVAEIDLYEVIGIDLEDFNFETLLTSVLDELYESTGYDLTPLAMDAFAEMTVGKIVEKPSLSAMNNYTRYTMEYAGANRADMITIMGRLLIQFITHDENAEKIKAILRENVEMDDTSYGYVSSLIDMFMETIKSDDGMDAILGAMYYVVYGLDVGSTEFRDLYDSLNKAWEAAFETLAGVDPDFYNEAVKFLEKYFPDIINPGGILAPNGFMAFFQRITEFFNRIRGFFAGLFS